MMKTTQRTSASACHGWAHHSRRTALAASLAMACMLGASLPAHAADPVPATPEEVASAIAGGLQYLSNQFHDNGDGTGYWNDYDQVTGTATAVAALIESGQMANPTRRAMIEKGIAYLLTQTKPDGGIYMSVPTYEVGLVLVALSLYGQATTTDAAYRTVVQNAVNFLKSYQNIEGSPAGGDYGPNGEATTTNSYVCGPAYATYYGGWGYSPTTGSNHCGSGSDLSNSQFAVMGLWYGSRFLGLPVDSAPWAKAMLAFLKNRQDTDGGFFVYDGGGYKGVAANGGGLWSLAMIGQTEAKKAPGDTNTMVQNALNWYAANYTWNYSNAYMYAIYGVSKALTANIGPATKVGTHDWASDMKTEVVNSASRTRVAAVGDTPAYDYWDSNDGLDPEAVGQTSWVLMSLAFASTTSESTEKLLAQEDRLDNVVRGLVTLHTTGGVTISAAERGMVSAANLGANVVLPVGSFNFTLNNVTPGGTTTLTITPPAGALDPANPNSFVKADGTTVKDGLNWFKITDGAWKGQASVPITVDFGKGVIAVILKDGGPEDADGVANGKIVDPGAPGYGVEVVAEVPEAIPEEEFSSGGCTVGNGPADPTLLALMAGSLVWLLRRRRSAGKAK